jgi:transposase
MKRLSGVLPESRPFPLDAWLLDDTARQLTLMVTSTPALVSCPVCRFPTRRVHSRDVRTGAALPWGPWRVVPHLRVRKFFCAHGRCPRHMFTERLWPLVAPWARRTQRLLHWLAPGARAGGRLSPAWGVAVSRHTLLRLRRRLPLPAVATPQVRGVAEWAARERQTSGTVLIDLERRRPLALVPAREAKPFALWLQAHPGVGVSPRERSRADADGARQGAPAAMQVAARCHLRHNLAEAPDHVLNADGNPFEAVHAALRQALVARPDGAAAMPGPPPPLPRTAQELAYQRQARRLTLPHPSRAFHPQGWPGWVMAQHLGRGQHTVDRDRRMETLPARQRRTGRGRSLLTPDTPELSNGGMRGAVMPCASAESSNRGATPAVMSPSPAAPSACARHRASRRGRGRACSPPPHRPSGDLAGATATRAARCGRGRPTHPAARAASGGSRRPRLSPGRGAARARAGAGPAGALVGPGGGEAPCAPAAVCQRAARRR